jgi:hypothetical protein
MSNALELLKLGLAFISGGLAGAIFTYFANRQRQRVETGIKLAERYLAEYDEIGACKSLLSDAIKSKELPNQNRIRRMGDLYELVAILCDAKYASSKFVSECGLTQEMRRFHDLVTARKNEPQSPYNDAWLWWPHLEQFVKLQK